MCEVGQVCQSLDSINGIFLKYYYNICRSSIGTYLLSIRTTMEKKQTNKACVIKSTFNIPAYNTIQCNKYNTINTLVSHVTSKSCMYKLVQNT